MVVKSKSLFRKTSAEAFSKDQFQGGFYKPRANQDNEVRQLPCSEYAYETHGRELPHIKIWVHFSVGPSNATIVCNLKMGFSTKCEICRLVSRLTNEQEKRDLSAKQRYRSVVYDYSAPEKGQQIWEMGYTVKEQLDNIRARLLKAGEPGFEDPEEGCNIIIDRKGEGQQSKYVVTPARKSSPIPDWMLKDIEEKGFLDLEATVKPATDQEIRNALAGGEEEYDDDDEEEYDEEPVVVVKTRRASTKATEAAAVNMADDDEEDEEDVLESEDEGEEEEEEAPPARAAFRRGGPAVAAPAGARPMRTASAAGNRFAR